LSFSSIAMFLFSARHPEEFSHIWGTHLHCQKDKRLPNTIASGVLGGT